MKHIARIAAIVAVAVSPAFAQAAKKDQPDAAGSIAATPAIWRAADNDTEVFLLGTFHILPANVDWRTDAIQAALDASDVVYFEVDAEAADAQTKTVGVMMTEGFNADGAKLTDILDEDDAAKLRSVTASLGLPLSAIDPMRPWQAFLTLTVQFIVSQGFDPSAGVDSVLLKEARTLKKEVRFFETIEEQLALFTTLSPKVEKHLLTFTLRDWENQTASFDELFGAWASGDGDVIDTQMNVAMREDAPEVFDALLTKRNSRWAKTLDEVLKTETGSILVAVGAAHLAGDGSVPALLEKRGYAVARYDGAATDPVAANDNDAEGNAADEDDAVSDSSESMDEEPDAVGDLLREIEN